MSYKTYIEISIYGNHVERFFNMCIYHNVKLHNIYQVDNYYYASIHPACFFSLKKIANKTQVKINILSKNGLYFLMKRIKKQRYFFIFPMICIGLMWLSSSFLWDVTLEGNQFITKDMIRDYLYQQGIHYGMPLKEIPIQQITSDLRDTFPEITWVSIYLEGTSLKISLKENDNKKYNLIDRNIRHDLTAPLSGIVDSILIRKGTAMIQKGDIVKRGDVLIAGFVEVPTEDSSVKNNILCEADGEVTLLVDYPIQEQISVNYKTKEYSMQKSVRWELCFPYTSIIIPNSKIDYVNYDVVTIEKDMPLFKVLSMPIGINQKIYYEYSNVERKYSKKECEKIMKERLEEICITLIEKGVQIIEKNVKIETNSVYSTMSGNLTLKVNCNNNNTMEEYE